MTPGFSLKDHLFNADTVAHLGEIFANAGVFDPAPFVAEVLPAMAPLELKARINLIADVLSRYLPRDFDAAAMAIRSALPPPLDPTRNDDDFGDFIYAPLGVYVENHGLAGHLSTSLDLMEAITQRFSMEFSIRAFLNAHQTQTLERMRRWVHHDHYHVRRLASEGSRPRLPWGRKIHLTAAQTLPLLDALHADPTRYVTRSVANHLNDITKTDPDLAIAQLDAWQSLAKQDEKELAWIRRHALRGLIKSGHPGAMAQLGYAPDVPVKVSHLHIYPDEIAIGDAAELALTIVTQEDAPLIVDYIIDFVKSNGSSAPKVFKMKALDVKAGIPIHLVKKHIFRAGATTFTHFPGAHKLQIQINGRVIASCPFILS